MKRLRYRSVVDEADSRVSIVSVLQTLGVDITSPPSPGSNVRVLCPFEEINHSGTLRDRRQMRVYSDNRAYCHECQCQYTPTKLLAADWGCSRVRAAQQLLGVLEAEVERTAPSRLPVLRINMAAALAVWADSHDVDRMSDAYGAWISMLDRVESDADALEWLTSAKRTLS